MPPSPGNDEELVKLTKEIREMKKTRVDLLKDMRAQNKKFQAFKSAKNKEVAQVKQQGDLSFSCSILTVRA